MERKDAIAAVIAGTGILAAATIAGLAVVKLASPESTGITETVSAVKPAATALPVLPTTVPLVPQLPAATDQAQGDEAMTQQAPLDDPAPANGQPAYAGNGEQQEYEGDDEGDEYEGDEYDGDEHEGDEEEEGHDDDDD